MANGNLYREILLEMYRDYPARTLPIWVRDGLVEEGFAEETARGAVLLTADGEALSQKIAEAEAEKAQRH
ncbi:hypothetical protein GGD81_002892 [Rhodobium orientis]|nr:hypothetical protein [Rhodobium orientis]MBB4303840.1 hypothetical protein [Rhodobium orientis]